jgi:hypothetical protein
VKRLFGNSCVAAGHPLINAGPAHLQGEKRNRITYPELSERELNRQGRFPGARPGRENVVVAGLSPSREFVYVGVPGWLPDHLARSVCSPLPHGRKLFRNCGDVNRATLKRTILFADRLEFSAYEIQDFHATLAFANLVGCRGTQLKHAPERSGFFDHPAIRIQRCLVVQAIRKRREKGHAAPSTSSLSTI